jgi:hypothetical protein
MVTRQVAEAVSGKRGCREKGGDFATREMWRPVLRISTTRILKIVELRIDGNTGIITFDYCSMQRTLGNLFLDRHAFCLFNGSRRSLKLKALENLGEILAKLTSKEITVWISFSSAWELFNAACVTYR